MSVRVTTASDIFDVCENLREADRVEQFATRFNDSSNSLAKQLFEQMPRVIKSFTFVGPSGKPAVILSATLEGPGVAKLHRIATDEWDAVRLEVFRFGLQMFVPMLRAVVHRAECMVLSRHTEAIRMLTKMGFIVEGCAHHRGRNGEDFAMLAWFPDRGAIDHVR